MDISDELFQLSPGHIIAEKLKHLGMTQAELSRRTGRPKKTINEIVKGKCGVTATTALQIERVLGIPSSKLLRAESDYRLTIAREKAE